MGFWDGFGGAMLTGGLSLLGGMTSANSASSGVESMNAANAAEAEKNRQFQLYMSNTAHTREVADLRNAGLNPILSATGGSGASTPGGSVIPMQNTQEQSSLIKSQMMNLAANTAKALAEAKTEVTKQGVNNAQQKALGGSINIPGVGNIPIDRAAELITNSKLGVVGRIKKGVGNVVRAGATGGLPGISSMIGAYAN